MDRWVALLALAACEPVAATSDRSDAPPVTWVYPPAPGGFPLGAIHGRLGRSQPVQPGVELGIAAPDGGGKLAPLRLATAWPVPGDGPARAVLYGTDGDHPAIELIDIDRGRVMWRDATVCAAPVVGATAEAIVCADANGTRAVGLDGKLRWSTRSSFIVFTGERVAVSEDGVSIILDAASGDELARIKLPRGVSADAIVATCGDAGRELFAIGDDGKLLRVAEAIGGPAISWATPTSAVVAIDACEQPVVVVTESGAAGPSLVAIVRETGKVTGRVDGVVASWPARDGSDRIEVATALGVMRYPRDLAGPAGPAGLAGVAEPLALPPLGKLLASRGDRRLVRATPLTAVLLDRAGVRAYLPLAAMGAVLGDASLLATSWVGSQGESVRRVGLPSRWRRNLRLPPLRSGVAVDAELRDLPPVLPLDTAGAVVQPATGMRAVTALAIDPADGTAVYAIALDERAGAGQGGPTGAVARADLSAKQWRWQRSDGCGPGTPVALAVARDVVVCGSRGPLGSSTTPAMVRATSRDGAARWDWITDNVDAVVAGGDLVAVHDAHRVTVLDARDGRVRGRVTSDDGAAARVAIVAIDDATLAITAERGRIVARLGLGGFLPLWSIAVAGTVRGLAPSGEGVLVILEDGDAYRIDARSATVISLPGLGLAWHATGDAVTGHTRGGPIPGPAPPAPPLTPAQMLRRPLQILRAQVNPPAPMSAPIKPPLPLGDSWQLAIYQLAGGLRGRNDYALAEPVAPPSVRGPPGSPVVVAYGPNLHEVIVLDPRTGDPLRRVRLPDDAPAGAVFGTIVDGSPVAGTLLASPLRVVLF